MFQVYLDESGYGDKQLFVMAGYIARADNWARFSDEWQSLLDYRSPHYRTLESFRMAEMQSAADRERCEWFYRIIEKYVHMAIAVVVDVAAVNRVYDSFVWPNNMESDGGMRWRSPYFLAFHSIILAINDGAAKLPTSGPIDFIFDDSTEQEKSLHGWRSAKRFLPEEVGSLMGDPPIYRNDKTTLPLQAADLLAWWVRYWVKKEGAVFRRPPPMKFGWPEQREIPTLVSLFTERKLGRLYANFMTIISKSRAPRRD
jgi:hypothetical protein